VAERNILPIRKVKLRFPDLPGSPSYALDGEFSIGTKETDLVLAHPSLSPKHATLFYEEDMLFVIDHQSIEGTKVNNHKIESGRRILLEDEDVLHFGSVKMKFEITESLLNDISDKSISKIIQHQELMNPPPPLKPLGGVRPVVSKKIEPVKKQKSFLGKLKPKVDEDRIANAFVRLLGLIQDVFLALGIGFVLKQDAGAHQFITDATLNFSTFIQGLYKDHVVHMFKSISFVTDLIVEVMVFLNDEFNFLQVLLLTGLFRIVSTIFFGVSLGQYLSGIRTPGPFMLKRVMGVIREIVGFVTGPILIADFPALVSQRTLKEWLSFTKQTCPSIMISSVSNVIFLPLTLAFFLVSPLLNLYGDGTFVSTVERKWGKPKWAMETSHTSTHLGFSLPSTASSWWIFPRMNPSRIGQKMTFLPAVEIASLAGELKAELSLVKNFSMEKLFQIPLAHQWFLKQKFPLLDSKLSAEKIKNPEFKSQTNENDQKDLSLEMKKILDLSFKLELTSWMTAPQDYGYLTTGLNEFKLAFLDIVENPEHLDLEWVQSENQELLSVSFSKPTHFDLFIPLNFGQGHVYRMDYPKEGANRIRKLLVDNFFGALKFSDLEKKEESFPSALTIVDALVELKNPEGIKGIPLIYSYYFFQSLNILKLKNPLIEDSFKMSLDQTLKYLESLKGKPDLEALHLKIAEINVAFLNRQLDYFKTPQGK